MEAATISAFVAIVVFILIIALCILMYKHCAEALNSPSEISHEERFESEAESNIEADAEPETEPFIEEDIDAVDANAEARETLLHTFGFIESFVHQQIRSVAVREETRRAAFLSSDVMPTSDMSNLPISSNVPLPSDAFLLTIIPFAIWIVASFPEISS